MRPSHLLRAILTIAIATLASGCLAFHAGRLPGEPGDATFATCTTAEP